MNEAPDQMTNQSTNQGMRQVDQQVAPDAFQQDITRAKGLIERIKRGIKEKRELARVQATQAGAPSPKLLDKRIVVLLIVAGMLLILVVATAVYSSLRGRGQRIVLRPSPQPTATASSTPREVTNPSRYATDSAVLGIEEKIKALDKDLVGTQVEENSLTPPLLDWEIDFRD